MPESCFYRFTPAGALERPPTLQAALASLQDGGLAWLDFRAPAKEELAALIEPLGIHPLSIEDCLDDQQVPKIDEFPTYTFLLFNGYRYAGRMLHVDEVDILLGKNFLVTVSGQGGMDGQLHARLGEHVRLNLATARKGPDFLLHIILDHLVDGKLAAIEALEDDIDAAEEAMLQDASEFQLSTLLDLRRALLSLRKSLFHEREVLMKICRRDCRFISEPAIYDFRDAYDHLAKYFELIEMNRDIVTSLTEMYLSLINNQMATVANKTNKTVRRLTLITTIFMPLSLLAGIGGMSEWSMVTGPENWRVAYPAFLAGMLVIGAINWYVLKWMESRRKGGKK